MEEVFAPELLLGDMRLASLPPEPTTAAAEGGGADDDEEDDDEGVLVEEITRESWLGPPVPANRFLAATGRTARAFPVAAASTAEAMTGFPPGMPDVTKTFLPLAALASEVLLGISIDAARLPEATTDERVGGGAVEPVSELISCCGAAD